ncbi:MAG: HTH domain-containing protein [Natronomonas sp.]
MFNDTKITVICYAREPIVSESVESNIELLERCEDGRLVDRVVLRGWPEGVRLDGEESPTREVVGQFEQFEAWGKRHGVSIRPAFERRTRCSIADDEHSVLVTPLLCLAIYRNQELSAVFPHSVDGETYTVNAAIERLLSGKLPTPSQSGRQPDRLAPK